jgi:hypothetical protein
LSVKALVLLSTGQPSPFTPCLHRSCLQNELSAAALQAQQLQWLQQAQDSTCDVDARVISAARVLKAQQDELQALKQQGELLSQARANAEFLFVRMLNVSC